tara:strand:+ start:15940 stop:16167 length:228 start_codon:yes stop_codon:yes gene_type:complete
LEKDNWKKDAVSYSENILFGNSIRTYYNNKKGIVHCENSSVDRKELLKGLKRLNAKDLNRENVKPFKKRRNAKNK